MKAKSDNATLFDDIDDQVEGGAPCVEGTGESPVHPVRSAWVEVSQEIFLSWSDKQQLEYCVSRDLDSADFAETPDDIDFFLSRAKSYMEMIAVL